VDCKYPTKQLIQTVADVHYLQGYLHYWQVHYWLVELVTLYHSWLGQFVTHCPWYKQLVL